jgi:hypothetical protein
MPSFCSATLPVHVPTLAEHQPLYAVQPVAAFYSISAVLMPNIVDEDPVINSTAGVSSNGNSNSTSKDVGDVLSNVNINNGVAVVRNKTSSNINNSTGLGNYTKSNGAAAGSFSIGLAVVAGLLLAALL